jgi:glycosyltransferase involved in cell wall biosynthesis
MGVLTNSDVTPPWATAVGLMRPLIPEVIEWQPGILDIPMGRGDLLIVCGGPRTLSTLALLVKARLLGVRTVWFGHYWSSTTRAYRFYIRMALMKLVHVVLFYTDAEIAEYRAGVGKNDRRLLTAVNNGISIEPIAALRNTYQASDRPREILFIGRLIQKCALDLLLSALASPSLAGVKLNVIGDGDARGEYQRIASDLGLGDRVIWHGGTVDESKIAAVANRSRLFAFPGSVGLSVIHAMGYGLPPVVNDNRWTNGPEVAAVTDGVTGRLFSRDDPSALARVLAETIDNAALLEPMSAAARNLADTVFNTREMAKRVIEMVDRMEAQSA